MCVRRENDLSHGWNSGESQGITKPNEGQIGEEQPAGVTLLRGPGDTGLERPVGAAEAEKALGLHVAWGPCAWKWSRDQRPAPVTENSRRPGRRPPPCPSVRRAWLPAALGSRLTVLGQAGLLSRTCVGAGGAVTFPGTLTLIPVRGLRRDLQRGSCRPKG